VNTSLKLNEIESRVEALERAAKAQDKARIVALKRLINRLPVFDEKWPKKVRDRWHELMERVQRLQPRGGE
jgi:hypothetical protein